MRCPEKTHSSKFRQRNKKPRICVVFGVEHRGLATDPQGPSPGGKPRRGECPGGIKETTRQVVSFMEHRGLEVELSFDIETDIKLYQ